MTTWENVLAQYDYLRRSVVAVNRLHQIDPHLDFDEEAPIEDLLERYRICFWVKTAGHSLEHPLVCPFNEDYPGMNVYNNLVVLDWRSHPEYHGANSNIPDQNQIYVWIRKSKEEPRIFKRVRFANKQQQARLYEYGSPDYSASKTVPKYVGWEQLVKAIHNETLFQMRENDPELPRDFVRAFTDLTRARLHDLHTPHP